MTSQRPAHVDKATQTRQRFLDEFSRQGLSVQQVIADVRQRRKRGNITLPHPDTLARWFCADGHIPLDPRTRDTVARAAILVANRDAIIETYEAEYARTATCTTNPALPRVEPEPAHLEGAQELFGTISAAEHRPYDSVDHITVQYFEDGNVRAQIRRLQPPHESRFRWIAEGTRYGEALFLTFRPEVGDPASRGVIVMRQVSSRPMQYEGSYRRWGPGRGLFERPYTWTEHVPQAALSDVALLDFDWTLRRGWLVEGWLRFLASSGMTEALTCLDSVSDAIGTFKKGEIDHDTLAVQCAEIYAHFEKTMDANEIASEARAFAAVSMHSDLRRFAVPLVRELKLMAVAPIVVTGAPEVVLKEFARHLGIECYHALRCEGGVVVTNPGTSSGKRAVARRLTDASRRVVLGIGDSMSDAPIFEAAINRVVVLEDATSKVDDQAWARETCLKVKPTASADEVTTWVAQQVQALRR